MISGNKFNKVFKKKRKEISNKKNNLKTKNKLVNRKKDQQVH